MLRAMGFHFHYIALLRADLEVIPPSPKQPIKSAAQHVLLDCYSGTPPPQKSIGNHLLYWQR